MKLRFERDMVDVTMLSNSEPDPRWHAVDAAGHEHRWKGSEVTATRWVETERYWCDSCNDEHVEGELRCSACGAVVEPGYRSGRPRTYIPGSTHYFIDDEPVSKEQFEVALAEATITAGTR